MSLAWVGGIIFKIRYISSLVLLYWMMMMGVWRSSNAAEKKGECNICISFASGLMLGTLPFNVIMYTISDTDHQCSSCSTGTTVSVTLTPTEMEHKPGYIIPLMVPPHLPYSPFIPRPLWCFPTTLSPPQQQPCVDHGQTGWWSAVSCAGCRCQPPMNLISIIPPVKAPPAKRQNN